ncbi:MAG: glycoside hydrolase family 2 protein [Chloroflexi bacterium]|nr:glycoside hydrolase family 2 protein [Chloroflexota bacterium]
MRHVENFNQDWLFTPRKVDLHAPDDWFGQITLPHTNKLFKSRFVDNREYQFISTYRKRFSVDETTGKRVFLDFDGVMLQSTVYLNSQLLGEHAGGYTPFSFEITDYLVNGENILTVYVDSTENESIPPYGGRVDYLTFGGIYRDVYLRVVHPCHIVRVFARPLDALETPRLECDIQLSVVRTGLSIEAILEDAQGNEIARQLQQIDADNVTISFPALHHIELWSLENPVLYNLILNLSEDGQYIDRESVSIGFRSTEFSEDGNFYLNGQPLKLFGLNRHQTYPYIGAAAPARLQALDADILKYELGCNIVRTSHYPQSPHFLKRCDEIGLLVFEEIPGWQHIGDEAWQAIVLRDVRAMIERDRNHPSIILWGVRINESPDNDDLYGQTNALAHELDPTRQTGGVRNFIASNKLEDVFTLNDFPPGIQKPVHKPHLITEFVGHMFPTKTWDQEERRIEHALHHARKHNDLTGCADIAGGIGWCAFDYHTHREFGSGDRICHHGVMDIFRLPKMAAYFYRSQKSPEDKVVLYAATNWSMGDRSGSGNNPLVVFSNCNEIEVITGDSSQGRFQPDVENYPNLRNPPFVVRWGTPYNPWGSEIYDLTVNGFLNGELAAQHRIASDHLPRKLRLSIHTSTLKADGSDMTRIAVQIVDKYGNVLPYQQRIVEFRLEGDGELIGENPAVLSGGQVACYVRSGKSAGQITVTAWSADLPEESVTLQIEA